MSEEANLLTTVTPHNEALVTAIGLLTAIPAVMAYNLFVQRVRRIANDSDGFGADCLNAFDDFISRNDSTPQTNNGVETNDERFRLWG